jgi:hypothetical protein
MRWLRYFFLLLLGSFLKNAKQNKDHSIVNPGNQDKKLP